MATRKPLVVVSGRKRELPAGDMVARADVDLGATLSAIADGTLGAFSHRNKVINGGFAVNQRVYVSGAATTAGQYTLDRWKVTGTGGVTFSTTANKTTVTIPSGQALQQVIEGLNLQSGTYVLSWEGTAQGKIGAGSLSASGVTGSITGGTNTTIEFGPGTVANVQLEPGSVETPFADRPIGTELALCQRYYYRLAPGATATFSAAYSLTTTVSKATIILPVTMRVAPTALEQSGAATDYAVQYLGTVTTCSAVPTISGGGSNYMQVVTFTVASGLTAGLSGDARTATGVADGYLGFSAEL